MGNHTISEGLKHGCFLRFSGLKPKQKTKRSRFCGFLLWWKSSHFRNYTTGWRIDHSDLLWLFFVALRPGDLHVASMSITSKHWGNTTSEVTSPQLLRFLEAFFCFMLSLKLFVSKFKNSTRNGWKSKRLLELRIFTIREPVSKWWWLDHHRQGFAFERSWTWKATLLRRVHRTGDGRYIMVRQFIGRKTRKSQA